MDISSLSELREQHPELLDEFKATVLEEFKAGSEQEAQVARLTAELKETREAADKKATRLDELETEKKAMERGKAVEDAITEAKLPEFAVTDEWRKSILSLEGAELKAVIEDRKKLIEKASTLKHTAVSGERGTGDEEMKSQDLKEALME